MAAPLAQSDEYELKRILLVGGKLYAEYEKDRKPYMAHVCHVLKNPFVLINTVPCKVDCFSTRISRHFRSSHLITDEKFFVVEKIKDVNGQVHGKQRRVTGEAPKRAVWLPIQVSKNDILYVQTATGKFKLVILENDRPWSSLEKALVGTAAGVGVAAVAVGAAFLAIFAAPAVVAGVGFGAGGIAAGSTAAGAMSVGVVSVATLQSIGAAGMGIASTIIVGSVGAATGTAVGGGITSIAVLASSSKSTPMVIAPEPVSLDLRDGLMEDVEKILHLSADSGNSNHPEKSQISETVHEKPVLIPENAHVTFSEKSGLPSDSCE